MKRKATWIMACCAALLAVAFVFLGNAPTSSETTADPVAVGSNQAGLRVHIDPDTKEIIRTAPVLPENIVKDPTGPFSTSHEGLYEQAAPVGGGQMVDLQGRFQQGYTAAVDANGEVTAGCGIYKSEKSNTQKSEKE